MKEVLKYLKDYKKEIVIGPILKLVEAIIEVLLPFFIANLIDKMFVIEEIKIIRYGIFILILVLVGFILAACSQYFAAKASQGYGTNIRNKLFSHINNLSDKQIDKISIASLTNILTNDVNSLEVAVAMWIRLVIRVPFICIGALVMCFIINSECGSILFISMITLGIATFFFVKKASPLYKIAKEKLDILSSRVKENLQNIRVVRAFASEEIEIEKFNKSNEENNYYTKKSYIISRVIKSCSYINIKSYNN